MKTAAQKLHSNAIKVFVFYSFFLFSAHAIVAQTTTVLSGNWSNASNWNNGVPDNHSTASVVNAIVLDDDISISENANYSVSSTGSLRNSSSNSYEILVEKNGVLDVDGPVKIDGSFTVQHDGVVTVRSYDTLIVGDAYFAHNASVTVEEFAVMIINGDLSMKQQNYTTLDGQIFVNGNIDAKQNSTINGTGNIQATGTTSLGGSSTFFGSTSNCNPGPCEYGSGMGLPVELVEFKAVHSASKNVRINWVTESEINNDFFILEKSKDGSIFNEIAVIRGNGTKSSRTEYAVTDNSESTTIYYRLSQVDFNGDRKTFNPIVLSPPIFKSNELTIYPNPAKENQDIYIKHNFVEEYTKVELRDISGKILFEKQLEKSGPDLKLDNKLPTGIYFLNFRSASENITEKLIVAN